MPSCLNPTRKSLSGLLLILVAFASCIKAISPRSSGGGGTGYMYAFDMSSGAQLWKFAVPGGLDMSRPYIVAN